MRIVGIVLVAIAASGAAVARAEDHATLYRFDPFEDRLVEVAPAEVKPGRLYQRYSSVLQRRTWSLAQEDGGFEFAMGPGSTQAAWRLDLRATPEQQRAEVLARAPQLIQLIDSRNVQAVVRLDDQGRWKLLPRPAIANVYDEETLLRWEWHGERRVAVIHTYGDQWLVVDDRFVPATIGTMLRGGTPYGGCW